MKKQLYFLIFLGIFAFLIRILFVSKVGAQESADGLLYSNIAINFLLGKGFIQTIRPYEFITPPLYPIFLAFIYLIFGGENYLTTVIIQSLFGALTCVLIYLIGRKIFNTGVGILSSLYFAVYPISIWWNSFFLTETIYTFFLVFFIWYLIYSFSKNKVSIKDLLFTGFLWGLCNLIRPNILFFFPLLFLWILLVARKNYLKYSLLIFLGMVITIAPWILYTRIVYGVIVPIGSYGTEHIWLGNSEFTNPDVYLSTGLYNENQKFQEIQQKVSELPGCQKYRYIDAQCQNIYKEEIKKFIIYHPSKFLTNFFKKIVTFWRPASASTNVPVLGTNPLFEELNIFINRLYSYIIYLLPVGILLALTPNIIKSKYHFLIIFILIYYSLSVSFAIIVYGARYRLPIMPFAIMYMFFPVVKVFELINNKFKIREKFLKSFHLKTP